MFDPYHKWLGIPPDQRPPTYYQLLGVSPDEHDPDVIEEVALMRIAHVRNYQLGPHAEECSRLLRELGEASETLCDSEKRAAYDAATLPQHKPEPASQSQEFDAPAAAPDEVQRRQPTPAPPEPARWNAAAPPTSPEPVSSGRPEDEILHELSNEAMSDLRRPIDPEAETFRELAHQLFQDWSEQLPPWWPTLLRRLRDVLVLVVLATVVFYLVSWLF